MVRVSVVLVAVVAVLLVAVNRFQPSKYPKPYFPIENVSKVAKTAQVDAVWYDLQPVSAPRLVGTPLKIFSLFLSTWPFSSLLSSFLLYDNKVYYLSQFGAQLPLSTAPVFYPVPQLTDSHRKTLNNIADKADVTLTSLQAEGGSTRSNPLFAGVNFQWVTVDDIIDGYESKAFTPSDIVRAVLAAVNKSNAEHDLNAIIQVNEANALAQAKESEQRYASGNARRLEGVPIAVKEETLVSGFTTTVGTTFVKQNPSKEEEATAVQRLRAAGAIIIGMTNMHEIGIGTTGANPHFRLPHNAVDPSRYPGGSSSGSGAAVGAGLVPVALGADGGGSIRIPAAFNGVVGLKASFGRISDAGNYPLCYTVGHLGPLSRSVHDTALIYSIIASPPDDPRDPASLRLPAIHFNQFHAIQDLSDVRLGVYYQWFDDSLEDIRSAAHAALKDLTERGAELVPIVIPHLFIQQQAQLVSIVSEMANAMDPFWNNGTATSQFNPETTVSVGMARHFSAVDYLTAQRVRNYAMQLWAEVFEEYRLTAVVTPSTAIRPPIIEADAISSGESNLAVTTMIMRYAFIGNLVGLPAISVPIYSHDAINAPVGIQFMAEHYREDILLRLASAVEDIQLQKYAKKIPAPRAYYDIVETAKQMAHAKSKK